jgi:hypothetical protein
VVCDDDVLLPYSGLRPLVALCRNLGLDIAQPAHRADSHYSHLFTRRRPGLLARLTGFVEIGPLVVFSPTAWSFVAPFPEQGMGWGTDVEWHYLRNLGLKLGIIDSIPLVHLGPIPMPGMPSYDYDVLLEAKRLDDLLRARGLASVRDVQYTDRVYPFWKISQLKKRERSLD